LPFKSSRNAVKPLERLELMGIDRQKVTGQVFKPVIPL
jgi:hypothetical protein